jgi:hypothetical protein
LRDLGFKSIKVASYDCGSFPLLRELKESFDEIIVYNFQPHSYNDVVIDTGLIEGSMTLSEAILPGDSTEEVLFSM